MVIGLTTRIFQSNPSRQAYIPLLLLFRLKNGDVETQGHHNTSFNEQNYDPGLQQGSGSIPVFNFYENKVLLCFLSVTYTV